MAKPKHGRWNNYANSATTYLPLPSSSSTHLTHLPYHLNSVQHRHRTSTRSPYPSSAVLSALAIIATTTSVVAGGPLPIQTAPPAFLCPFIERDNIDPTSVVTTPSRIQAASTSTAASPNSLQNSKRQPIADKYIKGPDDLWRKTDGWTLYGSTCCSSSTSTLVPQPDPTTSSPTPSSSSSASVPTSAPTAVEFDVSTLPSGWNNTTPAPTESTIILALAIVLACSICVFILGCVIWRKRRKKSTDTERKASHKLRDDDASEEDEREKDVRGKMRLWAKASDRWKSHIRHSARRRKKTAIVSKGNNLPRSPTPNDSREVLSGVSSAVSRRSSFTCQEPSASQQEASSSRSSNTITPPETPTLPPRFPYPPTYGPPVVPRLSSRAPSVTGDFNATISCGGPEDWRCPSVDEDELLPYLPPSDGHVATDDKVQLARIHELASSPLNMPDDPGTSTMVSAPAWHEVEDDLDLGVDSGEMPMSTPALGYPPLFPPPPAEASIPLSYLDGDPFRYGDKDDIQVSVPIPEPSAPSFDVSPSAPPISDLDLEPSAPSLEDEDDIYGDWDGVSSSVPVIPAPEASPVEPAGSSISSSSTLPPITPTRRSAARESALPRYQP